MELTGERIAQIQPELLSFRSRVLQAEVISFDDSQVAQNLQCTKTKENVSSGAEQQHSDAGECTDAA